MITPRDRKVMLHIGLHGWLSHRQIGLLEFPYDGKKDREYSYHMLQRRLREELLKENYVECHRLPERDSIGFTPIFKLTRKGARIYKGDTGNKASIPRFSQLKVPHRLEVNNILVTLKKANLIRINGFEIEHKLGSIRADAYIRYKFPFVLEVDLSGTEGKEFIMNKWQNYEREYLLGNTKTNYIVWYSKRADTLQNWIDEVHQSKLIPLFINPPEKNIFKVINYIREQLKLTSKEQLNQHQNILSS